MNINPNIITIEVENLDDQSIRLDQFLAKNLTAFSREKIKNLILNGAVKNGNIAVKPSYKINHGDIYHIDSTIEVETPKAIEDLGFSFKDIIVFEDEHMCVIDKPAGILSHAKPGGTNDTTIVDLAKHYFNIEEMIGQEGREFIVHRLDRDTSGLMILAKTNLSYEKLIELFKAQLIEKKYLGLSWNVPNPIVHTLKHSIIRDRMNRTKMHICIKKTDGKECITHYKLKKILFNGAISLIEFGLETGRTHQIRIQMNAIGCNIVNDKLYGTHKDHLIKYEEFVELKEIINSEKRHFLHSFSLNMTHPISEETLSFISNIPPIMNKIIELDSQIISN